MEWYTTLTTLLSYEVFWGQKKQGKQILELKSQNVKNQIWDQGSVSRKS